MLASSHGTTYNTAEGEARRPGNDRLFAVGGFVVGWASGNSGRQGIEKRRSAVWSNNLTPRNWPAREAAEAELLKRGPRLLDLLPPVTDRTSAEVRQRLDRVRQKLQQQAADAVARSSTITLQADPMPLSKVLAALSRQSGNAIVDYRKKFNQPATDPALIVHFDKTPFWPALDQVLDQAGLTIYPFAERGRSTWLRGCKADSPAFGHAVLQRAVSVRGDRRCGRRDLPPGRWFVGGLVETLWEPRLRIIGLAQRMAT